MDRFEEDTIFNLRFCPNRIRSKKLQIEPVIFQYFKLSPVRGLTILVCCKFDAVKRNKTGRNRDETFKHCAGTALFRFVKIDSIGSQRACVDRSVNRPV